MGGYVNSPHGWRPGQPVESAEGCLYPTWERIMDRETLRERILAGDDELLSHPIIWNRFTQEQKDVFLTVRASFQHNSAVTNAFLDQCVALYPQRQEDKS